MYIQIPFQLDASELDEELSELLFERFDNVFKYLKVWLFHNDLKKAIVLWHK